MHIYLHVRHLWCSVHRKYAGKMVFALHSHHYKTYCKEEAQSPGWTSWPHDAIWMSVTVAPQFLPIYHESTLNLEDVNNRVRMETTV